MYVHVLQSLRTDYPLPSTLSFSTFSQVLEQISINLSDTMAIKCRIHHSGDSNGGIDISPNDGHAKPVSPVSPVLNYYVPTSALRRLCHH